MSNLLADIALEFEALANDPIEMGIHYGKSVLKVLSNRVSKPIIMLDGMAARYTVDTKIKTEVTTKPLQSPRFRTTNTPLPSRASFRRNFDQVQTAAYTQRRGLVGSL